MARRGKVALVAVLGAFLVAGLLLRTPIRKAWKRSFSTPEISSGLFQNPEGLAVDSEGTVYVADQDRGTITLFDRAWNRLAVVDTVEGYVDGEGRPDRITRGCNLLAIAPRRLVLVGRHNVAEIDLAGEKPRLVRLIGSRGSAPGQMDGPEGLDRDANGDLYVSDEHNRRINVFDREGRHLRSWSVPQDPQTVRIWKDRVWVALNKRNYLASYSREGKELSRIGRAALFPVLLWITIPAGLVLSAILGLAKRGKLALGCLVLFGVAAAGGSLADHVHHDRPGQFRLPDFMLPSPDGSALYVTDRANARVQVVDAEGNSRLLFGSYGREPGRFRDPKDLAWGADGNLIVADSGNHRLQVFTPEGKFLRVVE